MLTTREKEKLVPQQISTAYAAIMFFHIESPFKSLLRSIKNKLELFSVREGKANIAF
jgi:hypothetical protein